MLDLKDIKYQPTIEEIKKYIANTTFNDFFDYITTQYKALCKIEYSKDVYFKGWNVKLKKSGKSLLVIYPRQGYFKVLVVIGIKEKDEFIKLYQSLSDEIKNTYDNAKEGNGQRWLIMDIKEKDKVYYDVLELVRIRRESR